MTAMDLHRLAEERSLELHRAVAAILEQDPARVEQARALLDRWIRAGSISAAYSSEWTKLLNGPVKSLLEVLVDEGERARALRQCTPFAGFIDPRTRWRIWREVRERMSEAS